MSDAAPPVHLPVVLTLIGAFWPGHDSSGPNLSYKAMAQSLGSEYSFLQVSRDRALGASTPAAPHDVWIDQGFAKARYCVPSTFGAKGLQDILRSTPHDCLVMNGFFDQTFTLPSLFMRRLGRVPRKPTILSPRGEFSGGALGLKAGRKGAYLKIARHLNLLGDVMVHATSERELEDIRSVFPWAGGYAVAPNIRNLMEPDAHIASNEFRVTFVGRISPIKNLDFALEVLARVRSPVRFTICGPVQDAAHWQQCRDLIAQLPKHVAVTYRGEVANDDMPGIFATTDLFFLPSKSENFGHSIFEALSCGTPVLIGDATPWRDLQTQDAGYDLPFREPRLFVDALESFAALGQDERRKYRVGARRVAEASVASSGAIGRTRQMFERVLSGRRN